MGRSKGKSEAKVEAKVGAKVEANAEPAGLEQAMSRFDQNAERSPLLRLPAGIRHKIISHFTDGVLFFPADHTGCDDRNCTHLVRRSNTRALPAPYFQPVSASELRHCHRCPQEWAWQMHNTPDNRPLGHCQLWTERYWRGCKRHRLRHKPVPAQWQLLRTSRQLRADLEVCVARGSTLWVQAGALWGYAVPPRQQPAPGGLAVGGGWMGAVRRVVLDANVAKWIQFYGDNEDGEGARILRETEVGPDRGVPKVFNYWRKRYENEDDPVLNLGMRDGYWPPGYANLLAGLPGLERVTFLLAEWYQLRSAIRSTEWNSVEVVLPLYLVRIQWLIEARVHLAVKRAPAEEDIWYEDDSGFEGEDSEEDEDDEDEDEDDEEDEEEEEEEEDDEEDKKEDHKDAKKVVKHKELEEEVKHESMKDWNRLVGTINKTLERVRAEKAAGRSVPSKTFTYQPPGEEIEMLADPEVLAMIMDGLEIGVGPDQLFRNDLYREYDLPRRP